MKTLKEFLTEDKSIENELNKKFDLFVKSAEKYTKEFKEKQKKLGSVEEIYDDWKEMISDSGEEFVKIYKEFELNKIETRYLGPRIAKALDISRSEISEWIKTHY
jgi:hypothetical protein